MFNNLGGIWRFRITPATRKSLCWLIIVCP